MAFISLKWFAGMVPRRGNQHLNAPHATEAENCNLYSGELRPLHKPALAHRFCRPEDDCWRQPFPDDPSVPPVEPPEPPNCIPVAANGFLEWNSPVPDPVLPGTEISATQYVNADATAPVQYQWFKNNIAIPGQVGPTLFYTVMEGDDYSAFTVLVQNPCRTFLSNPITIGAVGFFCQEYECDSLANVILATNPDYYYPMNIQSDLDNYSTDPFPIKDYAGYGNHLKSQGLGEAPVDIPSDWEGANCSGRMTGGPLNSTMSLETDQGDTINGNNSGSSFSAFFQPGGYLAGDKVYFKVEWETSNLNGINGVNAIFYSPTNAMRFQVFSTDQTGGSSANTIEYQFQNDSATYTSQLIGIIIYPEGVDLRYELYLDYDLVHTDLVPLNAGQTLSELEADQEPVHVQGCSSNAGSQELAMWYRRLSNAELSAMKAALAQNKLDYVDPDPACQLCKEYECDAFDNAITALAPDTHFKMTRGDADRNGLALVDSGVNATDLPQVAGGTIDTTYSPAPLPSSCTGTAFRKNGGANPLFDTGLAYNPVTAPKFNNLSGEGTMMTVWNQGGNPYWIIYWVTSGAQYYAEIRDMEGDGSFKFRMATRNAGGGDNYLVEDTFAPVHANGGIAVIATWRPGGGDTTEWFLYGLDGALISSDSMPGTVGQLAGTYCYRQTLTFVSQASQNYVFKQQYSSAAQIAALTDAWAQNIPGYVDTNPNCVPDTCKEYDCNGLRLAILETSPNAYYDMRNGYSDISTISGTPQNGDIMYDNIAPQTNNLSLIITPGDILLPSAPGLLDNCGGTAFNSNATTCRSGGTTNFTATGNGSMLAVHKDNAGGGSNGSMGVDWGANGDFIYFESGMASVVYKNDEEGQSVVGTILPEIAPGVIYGLVTWRAVGNDSIITIYDADGNVTDTEGFSGLIGDAASYVTPRWLEIIFLICSWQDCAFWNRTLTTQEIIALGDAAKRNLSTYVDPNPNCEPAP